MTEDFTGGNVNAKPMTFLSLFSGIGGLDLGLERAGMKCVGQVEIDPFCRAVLAKHWPNIPRFEDVRTITRESLPNDIDLIAGGFPCQDLSTAGRMEGIDAERSGLWREFYRLICEIRPRIVIIENVTGILVRGIDRVLGNLAEGGFDAEWGVLAASDFGAPHIRERVFIIGYTKGMFGTPIFGNEPERLLRILRSNAKGNGFTTWRGQCGESQEERSGRTEHNGDDKKASDSASVGCERQGKREQRSGIEESGKEETADAFASRIGRMWRFEPAVDRVAYGVSHRVDRLKGLGNAVFPPCAEFIGRAIVAHASPAPESPTGEQR